MSHKSGLSALLLASVAALTLGACDTMETAANSVGDGFSNLTTQVASLELNDLNPFGGDDTGEAEAASAIAPAAGDAAAHASMTTASGGNCPAVQVVNDLKQVHQFENPAAPDASEEISSVGMAAISNSCATDETGMVVDIELGFNGTLGPKGRERSGEKPSFAYPYFVAITNGQGSIIAKEVFAATLSYDKGATKISQSDSIRQTMPATGEIGASHRILVGFQLTPDELAYNRALPADAPVAIIPPQAGDAATPVTAIEPAAGDPFEGAVPATAGSQGTQIPSNDNAPAVSGTPRNPAPVTLTPADFAKE